VTAVVTKPPRRSRRQWRHPEGWIAPVWERADGLRIHTGAAVLVGFPGQTTSARTHPEVWARACAIEGCADGYGDSRRRALMRFADLVYTLLPSRLT
jgi:hypothetical protein